MEDEVARAAPSCAICLAYQVPLPRTLLLRDRPKGHTPLVGYMLGENTRYKKKTLAAAKQLYIPESQCGLTGPWAPDATCETLELLKCTQGYFVVGIVRQHPDADSEVTFDKADVQALLPLQKERGSTCMVVTHKGNHTHQPEAEAEILQRLVRKYFVANVKEDVSKLFEFMQVGVGMPGGCEVVVHVVR